MDTLGVFFRFGFHLTALGRPAASAGLFKGGDVEIEGGKGEVWAFEARFRPSLSVGF